MAKGKPGRPRIEIDLKQVEILAARGLTQEEIANALGIDQRTLIRRKKENCQFCQAIKKGQAKGVALVTSKLMEEINNGNTAAMMFFLKCKAKWQEKQTVDHTSSDGSMRTAPMPIIIRFIE